MQDRLLPFREMEWVSQKLVPTKRDDKRVQKEIDRNQAHGNSDRFLKPAQKEYAEQRNQHEGHANLVFQQWRSQGILDDVRSGVCGGESDRNDEIGGDEAEQYEYEEFALPA